MKTELINTNEAATEINSESSNNEIEEFFLRFLEQKEYSRKHIKNLQKGLKILTEGKQLESIVAGLEDPNFLKELAVALRKKHNEDIAKISLNAACRLQNYLLESGVIEKHPKYRTEGYFLEVEKEVHRYVYEERNFSEIYADRILKIFKDLTDFIIYKGWFDFSEIDQVFIFKFLPTVTASKTKMSNLRILLRFLFREGYLKADYSPMILSVRSKDIEVRKFLSPKNIESLLSSIDRETASGKQDYLFFILTARLGLRAIEILRLKLCDIDWDNSRLYIHGKHDYETTLPFSSEIGDAFLDYLKHSERGSDEHVFITMRAPYRKLERSKKFNSALRVMYKKSGIRPPTKKIHLNVFRHSLATSKLNSGVSMRDVKTIMRHKNVETTMVYAKYNLPSLTCLAAEWPGVAT